MNEQRIKNSIALGKLLVNIHKDDVDVEEVMKSGLILKLELLKQEKETLEKKVKAVEEEINEEQKRTNTLLGLENLIKGREDWNYRDWETKDPLSLVNLFKSNKAGYDYLLNKYLNK